MPKENGVSKDGPGSSPDPAPAAASPSVRVPDEDLSAQIILAVAKKPSERVTCTRITHNHYRCNWWSRKTNGQRDERSFEGLLVTTNRICQSHFLHVTKNTDGLKIVVVSSDGPPISDQALNPV